MQIDTNLIRRQLETAESELAHLSRQVAEETAALEHAQQQLEDALAAQNLLQRVSQAVQQDAHGRVASIVSRCLNAVFGEDAYEFGVTFDRKRGRTEATFTLTRAGEVLTDPLNECGGGVIDVISLGLRIACLMCSIPRPRPLLVLDEPLRMLSRQYRPAARRMLLTLSEELGVQIIMVTHSDELRCGQVIELEG